MAETRQMQRREDPPDVQILEVMRRCAPDFGATLKTVSKEEAAEVLRRLGSSLATLARRDPSSYADILATDTGVESIRTVAMTCLETGLYVGTYQPHAWAIPRKERGTMRLNWQVSARGLAFLAHRAGYTLACDLVAVGDKATIMHGDATIERTISAGHAFQQTGSLPLLDFAPRPNGIVLPAEERGIEKTQPNSREPAKLAGVLVVARDEGGRIVNWRWIGADQIRKRRDVAGTGKVWAAWPEEMIEKTAMIYAISRGICPTTTELRSVLEHDMAGDATVIEVPAPSARPAEVPKVRQLAEVPKLDDDPQTELDRRAEREPVANAETTEDPNDQAGEMTAEDRLRAEIEEIEVDRGVQADERARFRGEHGLNVPFARATMEQLRAYKARLVGGAK